MGRGQVRVVHLPLPQQPERGIDELAVEALAVQKGQPPLHVFQAVVERGRKVERAQFRAGFFLAVADSDAQQVLHAELAYAAHPLVLVHQHDLPAGVRVRRET